MLNILKKTYEGIENMMLFRKHRKKPTDFSRDRKLGFKEILTSIVITLKHSLALEIDNFIKKLDVDDDLGYTKSAYTQARQKLLPSAFIELNDIVLNEIYASNFKAFKNYRLIAIDGSTVELPYTKKLKEQYGVFSKNADCPGGRVCVAYDVLNEAVLSGKLSPLSVSEKALVPELLSNIPSSPAEDLFILDRGFPSTQLILLFLSLNKKFIFRVKRGFLKEIDNFRNSSEEDQTLTINITKRRIATNRIKNISEPFDLTLRCVRIKLESEDEILITNFTPEEMNIAELKDLYNMRWGIETNYDYLKNVLEIENFTGDTDIAIQQDFYATIYITNLATVMVKDAQAEYDKNASDKPKKYKYKTNRRIGMGYLKRDLLHALLQENPAKAINLYNKFIIKLSKQVVPIREGRKFNRNTDRKPKYGRTNKKIL